ncbi:uncharacterized protein [Lolium perenne]|uniref:uncharacterized protein n=1 Tax=Lolium perenne TaxID=4522 RepID=UPI003A98D03A
MRLSSFRMFPAATRQTKIAEFSSHLLVYNSEHFSATKAETNISSPSGKKKFIHDFYDQGGNCSWQKFVHAFLMFEARRNIYTKNMFILYNGRNRSRQESIQACIYVQGTTPTWKGESEKLA